MCSLPNIVANRTQCYPCLPGTSPNVEYTSCYGCTGPFFSPCGQGAHQKNSAAHHFASSHGPGWAGCVESAAVFGAGCNECEFPLVVNANHSTCELSDEAISDPSLVVAALQDSNVLPSTTIEIAADPAALVDGSVEQDAFIAALILDLSISLGVHQPLPHRAASTPPHRPAMRT